MVNRLVSGEPWSPGRIPNLRLNEPAVIEARLRIELEVIGKKLGKKMARPRGRF
jgi:hypothetical protein